MSTPVSVTASAVVVDLEGTTSAAGFILGDLYDYARPRLAAVLERDTEIVRSAREQIAIDAGLPADAPTEELVAYLHELMANDVKSTPLKTLQGIIWAEGFAANEITSHFFPDVAPVLQKWAAQGTRLAVYSSGSVASQQPWFRHAPSGDLSGLISGWFDTVNAGPKKEAASYQAIAAELDLPPENILFLTDHPEEVTAALAAGWQVVALDRAGEPWAGSDFASAAVAGFDQIEVQS